MNTLMERAINATYYILQLEYHKWFCTTAFTSVEYILLQDTPVLNASIHGDFHYA